MKRSQIRGALIVAAALLLVTTTVAGAGNINPGVLPPESHPQGLTYAQWAVQWWLYNFSIPAADNPDGGGGSTSSVCYTHRIGQVVLLDPNVFATEPVHCQIPAGTMLFLPVGTSAECSTLEAPPFYGGNAEELRTCAHALLFQNMVATIDGRDVQNIDDYLITTPVYTFTLPDDNILGVPGGSTGQSVGYSAFLMLRPLTPGMHTIHVHAEHYFSEFDFNFVADTVFDLSVTP